MSKTTTTSKSPLNLLTAFLPTIVLILYLQWDGIHMNLTKKLTTPVFRVLETAQPIKSQQQQQEVGSSHPFDRMYDLYSKKCPQYPYKVRLFSQDPLILYIDSFIPKREALYMTALAAGKYERSSTWPFSNETNSHDHTEADGKTRSFVTSDVRTSSSATIYDDPVAACIQERAAEFQGGISVDNIEQLQVVKYEVGKEYQAHFDYSVEDGNPRISTFFLYAACDHGMDVMEDEAEMTTTLGSEAGLLTKKCEGGSTNFPTYTAPYPESWCDVIECEDNPEETSGHRTGVSFKPIPGNAVFWSNMHANGSYHDGVLHAGLPVNAGRKIGINIWTRREIWDTDAYYKDLAEKGISGHAHT